MAEDNDRPTRQMPAVHDSGQARPTIKAFRAVQPDESATQQPDEADAAPHAPSKRELTLALMRLAEEVERLGGDVSEVRYLLGMKTPRER